MANMKALAAVLLLALPLASDGLGRSRRAAPVPHPIVIEAMPISFDRSEADQRIFGRLTWRGGLELTSDAVEFGGHSGIEITDEGRRMLAITDDGGWLWADLVYEKGRLAGLKNAISGPILDRKGRFSTRKRDTDAEGIALSQDKKGSYALISFEHKHRIDRYRLEDGTLGTPTKSLDLPAATRNLDDNKGLEALTVLTDARNDGTVLTFAEFLPDADGNHTGWLLRGKSQHELKLKRTDDFEVTGLATLPDGNVLLLERSFSLFAGVAMRLSEIDHRDLKPGALVAGRELLRADMRYNIDNMEGVAAHRNKAGETIVTLISDNNFNKNGLQRILLMQFRLD